MREMIRGVGAGHDLAETILDNPVIAHCVVDLIGQGSKSAVAVAIQWLGQLAPKIATDKELDQSALKLNSSDILELANMYDAKELSSTQAKVVFEQIILAGVKPRSFAQEQDMLQVSDSSELEAIVDKVLASNKKAADDVRNGEMKAIGYLVGQVMRESKGKANPAVVQDIIKSKLG